MPYRDPAQQKAWRDAHKAETAIYNAAYRKAHRERLNLGSRDYYAANRMSIRGQQNAARAQNPGPGRARARANYRANRERYLRLSRAYALAHPDRMRAFRKAWKKRHPEAMSTYNRKRKAAVRGAPICDLTRAQWEAIQGVFNHRCAYCGARPERLTQDHVIPVSKGGSHTASNIVPACARCNSSKGARLPGLAS